MLFFAHIMSRIAPSIIAPDAHCLIPYPVTLKKAYNLPSLHGLRTLSDICMCAEEEEYTPGARYTQVRCTAKQIISMLCGCSKIYCDELLSKTIEHSVRIYNLAVSKSTQMHPYMINFCYVGVIGISRFCSAHDQYIHTRRMGQ
jgi:hypothetical protein